MTTKKMPPLPSGSVDAAALNKAINSGEDAEKAIAAATVRKTKTNPVSEARKKRMESRTEQAADDGLSSEKITPAPAVSPAKATGKDS